MKERIFSGIKPSSELQIGNYLGAIKQWLDLQHEYESFFCVVDLHAITEPYDPQKMPERTLDIASDYLALGLDPKKSVIFVQSHVPEHTELMWLLNTIMPVSELERMTQYKDKIRQKKENIRAGLLNYPVLMAADILLYKASTVPVGEDQVQHVELTRDFARKFNHTFGQTFPEPKAKISPAKRIMSLTDPNKKMSKSDNENSCLFLSDQPEIIKKKIMAAVTATSGGNASPGVANLLTLLKEFSDRQTYEKFQAREKSGQIKYSELKEQLAKDIIAHFADYRRKRAKLKVSEVKKILEQGAKKARLIAQKTLKEVKEKMGLI